MKYSYYLSILITFMIVVSSVIGQEGERLQRSRLSSDIDRRTKRLYDQALDLMEHGRMRGVVVAAVCAARRDDAKRRLTVLHGADLHRRRMGAQKFARPVRLFR